MYPAYQSVIVVDVRVHNCVSRVARDTRLSGQSMKGGVTEASQEEDDNCKEAMTIEPIASTQTCEPCMIVSSLTDRYSCNQKIQLGRRLWIWTMLMWTGIYTGQVLSSSSHNRTGGLVSCTSTCDCLKI